MLLYKKQKRNQNSKGNRFLVSINVLGSAGPIRFVVKEDEGVANVMDYALKCYAREGRLPILGSDINEFVLYSPYSAAEALEPREMIGTTGTRNFTLCRKRERGEKEEEGGRSESEGRRSKSKGTGGAGSLIKAWLLTKKTLLPLIMLSSH